MDGYTPTNKRKRNNNNNEDGQDGHDGHDGLDGLKDSSKKMMINSNNNTHHQQFEADDVENAEEVAAGREISIKMLADSLPQLVWITRMDGYHEYFNQRWWDYTGLDPLDAAVSEGGGWVVPLHPDDYERSVAKWKIALVTQEPYEIEYRFRRASDGVYRWFLGRAMPWKDKKGNIVKWFGTCTDIHDQKLATEALMKVKDELEKAAKAKDDFLAMLSHELRTPLNAVLGWTQMLQLGELDEEEKKRAIGTIEENALIQAQLIEDMLDVSRIVNNKLVMNFVPLYLQCPLWSAIQTIRPQANSKKIELIVDIPSADSHPLIISADPFRLQQIVLNLLTNASKFTPVGGTITIKADRAQSAARIIIKDSGAGISEEFLPHIFERFRQADSSSTRHYGGLGLGLTIVKHLVELHGGTITATSEGLGKGSTFTILLPIVAVQPDRSAMEQSRWYNKFNRFTMGMPSSSSSTSSSAPSPMDVHPTSGSFQLSSVPLPSNTLEGLSVLVVDDENSARELVSATLRKYGAQVTDTNRGAKALQLLGVEVPNDNNSNNNNNVQSPPEQPLPYKIDVLVSDISMPAMDGFQMITLLRAAKDNKHSHLPAIALTAYASIEDKSKAISSGFSWHLSKPVDPLHLAALVKHLATTGTGMGNPLVVSAMPQDPLTTPTTTSNEGNSVDSGMTGLNFSSNFTSKTSPTKPTSR
eukprot:TRINITY_DN309_c0_g2_i2.p1 TRINITY_DN309_c0_g2~~TRINITY_DN309_c0_g2_i2.p1  ORF type:complete len:700 (-),score=174.08 TRINITY_DN309_c0_g2_i2:1488-3587(-)